MKPFTQSIPFSRPTPSPRCPTTFFADFIPIKTAPYPCLSHSANAAQIEAATYAPPPCTQGRAGVPICPAIALPVFLSLLAALFFLAPAPTAHGLPTYSASTPFAGDIMRGESWRYKFSYWESWGEIKVSKSVTFKIAVGFSPIPNYNITSRILGEGWAFPLFESVILPVQQGTYEMILPGGDRQWLYQTETANKFAYGDWTAQINKNTITAKTNSGWTLVFVNARLQYLKTPDGVRVDFVRDATGLYKLIANGKTLLTVKIDFDPKTTERIAHLTLSDGKSAILRYAKRPALTDGPGTRVVSVESLASIRWNDGEEKRYRFGENEFFVEGKAYPLLGDTGKQYYLWNPTDHTLMKDHTATYSALTIKGIPCRKINYANGGELIYGGNSLDGIHIEKSRWSDQLIKRVNIGGASRFSGLLRTRHLLDAAGNETLIEKCYYDEHGMLKRHFIDGKNITYEPGLEEAVDAKSGKTLWRKKKDAKGRILEYFNGTESYTFNYLADGVEVSNFDEKGTLLAKTKCAPEVIASLLF